MHLSKMSASRKLNHPMPNHSWTSSYATTLMREHPHKHMSFTAPGLSSTKMSYPPKHSTSTFTNLISLVQLSSLPTSSTTFLITLMSITLLQLLQLAPINECQHPTQHPPIKQNLWISHCISSRVIWIPWQLHLSQWMMPSTSLYKTFFITWVSVYSLVFLITDLNIDLYDHCCDVTLVSLVWSLIRKPITDLISSSLSHPL